MKKNTRIGFKQNLMLFLISMSIYTTTSVYADGIDPSENKNIKLCSNIAKLVANSKAVSFEPKFELSEYGYTSKLYKNIDIDKDGIVDELTLSCGTDGECLLKGDLSTGEEYELLEENMFYLVHMKSGFYAPVINKDKDDFPNESSSMDWEKYNARKKYLTRLYKLTPGKPLLVCSFSRNKRNEK